MTKSVTCKLCGWPVDHQDGGAAIMMAFCYRNTTTLSNISYCKSCFDQTVKDPLKRLDFVAKLNLSGLDETKQEEYD